MRIADDSLWTVKEVAHFLRMSRSWVYERAERGDLPTLRIGGALRFQPDAIRAWALGARADHLVALTPAAAGGPFPMEMGQPQARAYMEHPVKARHASQMDGHGLQGPPQVMDEPEGED